MARRATASRAVVALLVVAALAAPATSSSATATTAPDLTIDIKVTLTDSAITLSQTSVKRGQYGRFVVRNAGTRRHDFTFLTPRNVVVARTKVLRPGERGIVIIDLLYRGRYQVASVVDKKAIGRVVFRVT